MGGLDQVYETFSKKQRQYNKEEWIEYKKKEKQEVYELIDRSAEEIVKSGEMFKKYMVRLSARVVIFLTILYFVFNKSIALLIFLIFTS